MHRIKNFAIAIAVSTFLIQATSCKKKEQAALPYEDRVAQDPSYRIGKWHAILPQALNQYSDTIWFVNDTLTGWFGLVADSPTVYAFYKTYFPDPNHIAIITPAASWQKPGTMDTTISSCGMTIAGDTFGIYWRNGYNIILQEYVKKTN